MEQDCLACHATCGTCHVGTAPIANAGLQKNHSFEREPDNLQVCIPCHHLAGAGFFTQEKNLHVALGMDCISCHNTEQQFHGRGGPEEPQGMMTPGLIEANCNNCHQQSASSNEAHTIHNDMVSCQACHGTEYESCLACHNRVPQQEEIFKLGNFNGKLYPMVHTTGNMSADAFAHLGIKLKQSDLESKPTWAPYPTHFLQLAPIHKEGAKVMCENCHGNDEIFLQAEDLTFPALEKQYLQKTPRKLTEKELRAVKK
jgi:thiosulfate/3-mercaptopyruvate sulfurtransferase